MIRETINKTMKQKGISGKMLSDATGITTARISQFRNGRMDITARNLEKIFLALDIHLIVE